MAHIPTFIAKGAFQSGIAALTVPVPTGYRNDDLLLLFVEQANQTVAAPAGWTQVTNSPQGTGTAAAIGGVGVQTFYKIASGAEASVTVADSGDHTTAIMMAFRGADPANPIDVTAGSVGAASTAMVFPSVTTTQANELIVLVAGMDTDAASTTTATGYTNANLTGITEQHDQTITSGVGGGLAIATGLKVTAGSTGTTTATGSTAVTHAYLTIAIRSRADTLTTPRGQYLNDYMTPVGTGSNVPTATDGIVLMSYVSPINSLDETINYKVEAETTATSFDGTATVTNPTFIPESDDQTYGMRGSAMVYDAKNDRYVTFGGYDGTTRQNHVWAKSMASPGQPWRRITPTGTAPTGRNLHSAVYVRGTTTGAVDKAYMVVWGGFTSADNNDMYTIDLTTPGSEAWATVTQTGAPTARSYITRMMVSTPVTGQTSQNYIYLFGGFAGAARVNGLDRCTFNVNTPTAVTWTSLKATGAVGNPPIRDGGILDFKPSTNKLYLYGGYSGSAGLNDFWEYDITGNAWTQVIPGGTAPTGTALGTGGYDPVNNRFWFAAGWQNTTATTKNHVGYISNLGNGNGAIATYYFDGSDGVSDPNNNWTNEANIFDGSTATQATSTLAGSTSSNYVLGEGTNAPTSGSTITQVRARVYGGINGGGGALYAAIYTNGLGELLGTPSAGEDVPAYGSYVTLTAPTGGWTWQALSDLDVKVYASASGNRTVSQVEIEVTSGQIWVEVRAHDADNQGFASQASVASAVDTKRNWIAIHGQQTFDSTERYSYIIDFAETATSNFPVYGMSEGDWMGARDAPASIYDPNTGEFLVMNGFAQMYDEATIVAGSHVAEAWAYNPTTNSWRYATKGHKTMPFTEGSVAVYDTTRSRIIVFGGLSGASETHNEVWTMTADQFGMYEWKKLNPTGTPPFARWLTTAVYDPTNNRMLTTLGGSGDTVSPASTVWELSFSSSADGVWTSRTATGTAPTAVWGPGFADHPTLKRLYVFGGATNAALSTVSAQLVYLDYSTTTPAWVTPTSSAGVARRTPAFGIDLTAGTSGKLITFGGLAGGASTQNLQYWDIATGGAWTTTQPATQPDARRSPGSMVINGKLYITHGRTDSSKWYANTWELTPNYTTPASSTWINEMPRKYQAHYALFDPNTSGNYHWQGWTTEDGVDGTKVSYGSNLESATDFTLGSTGPATITKTHTTDSNKRKSSSRSHTTDAIMRKTFSLVHTTSSALKRSATKTHTTDAYKLLSLKRLIDNFNDNTTDTSKWTAFNAPSETGGTLQITSTLAGIYRGYTSGAYTLKNSETSMELVDAGNQALASWEVYPVQVLKFNSGSTNNTSWYVSGGNIQVFIKVAGVRSSIFTATYSNATYRFLRIRESGGTVFYDSSPDSVTWTNRASIAVTSLWDINEVYVEPTAGNWQTEASTTTAILDNFNVYQPRYTHSTSSNKRKATLATHTTSSVLRRASTVSHTTSANKKVAGITKFHTTDANKRASGILRTHTTNAVLRKQFTKTHTTDSIKRAGGLTLSHTTDAFTRTGIVTLTKIHTTDALKRTQNLISHTTNSLKRKAALATHTTNSVIRKGTTVSHTTSANKRVSGFTKVHTTNSLLRRQLTLSHTTNSLKRVLGTLTHSTSAFIRKSGTLSHSTDSLKRKATTVSHTTSSNLKRAYTASHTTSANKRTAANLVSHTTNALKRTANTLSHSTDSFKRTANVRTHTTNALLRRQIAKVHTTDALKRKQTTVSHTTSANKKRATLVSHTTNALKRSPNTRSHTTDAFKRTAFTLSHTTDSFIRKSLSLSHTTDSFLRTGFVKSHTTDSNKRRAYSVAHTTSANKRKAFTLAHTTDSLKKKAGLLVSHTTDSLKRTANTKAHTTSAVLRRASTLSHSTSSFLRKASTLSHTTNAFLRRAVTVSHTTNANKRRAYTALHTTSTVKRRALSLSHSTDSNKRRAFTLSHSTDSFKRTAFILSHSTDSFIRKSTALTHTTNAFLRRSISLVHTTSANKRKVNLLSHTTSANKKKAGLLVSHTTDANKRKLLTRSHTTDSFLRRAISLSHTTDSFIRKAWTLSHSTDSFKRTANTRSHTTDSNKKRANNLVFHTTNANKRKAFTLSHTTDSLKRSLKTLSHTTNSVLRRAVALSHSTDSFKRTGFQVTHSTNANLRKAFTLAHSTSANKRKSGNLVTHTTSSVIRKANVLSHSTDTLKRTLNTVAHSTNAFLRKSSTLSHSTNSFLRRAVAVSHSTSANKRKATILTHTTSANKRRATLLTHTTSANKRVANLLKTHTTNSLIRRGYTVAHSTDANKKRSGFTVSHSTSTYMRSGFQLAHNTDANIRKSGLTRSHTTDTVKRKSNLLAHSTNAFLRKANTLAHTTSANLRKALTKFHLTDANKRKATLLSHTTNANKRKASLATHTTDSNKKKPGNILTHTTNSVLRSVRTVAHTTSAVKRTANVLAHTTSTVIRRASILSHTTSANKRRATTVSHTTNSYLRGANQLAHSTSANKRKSALAFHTTSASKVAGTQKTHTTNAFKRKATAVDHTTDANLRKAYSVAHSTSAFLRRSLAISHSTDSNKRRGFIASHSTDANKRRAGIVTHTTSSNLRRATEVTHSTDSLLHVTSTVSHSTNAFLRGVSDVSHSTDSNKRSHETVSHSTDTVILNANYAQHSTDSSLWSYRGKKQLIVNGQWTYGTPSVLLGGVWVDANVYILTESGWVLSSQ